MIKMGGFFDQRPGNRQLLLLSTGKIGAFAANLILQTHFDNLFQELFFDKQLVDNSIESFPVQPKNRL